MTSLGRYKVNYQNQFVFVSEHANESHFTDGSIDDPDNSKRNRSWTSFAGNKLKPLIRVQSIDYGFSPNITLLNQYGQAGNFGVASVNLPDIYFNFEYLMLDGFNERSLDFIIDGKRPALTRFLSNDFSFGKNIFLITGPPNLDLIGKDLLSISDDINVVGIGNAILSQYALTAEVGSLPKARMSFEGFNIQSYQGCLNLPVPSIDPYKQCGRPDYKFSIPDIGDTLSYETIGDKYNEIVFKDHTRGIHPTAISVSLNDGSIISSQNHNNPHHSTGSAHIQGFTVNVPLGSTRMNRLGNAFELARFYNFPSKIELKFKAFLSELKSSNLLDELCKTKKHNLTITMHDFCSITHCEGSLQQVDSHVSFLFKGAVLDSEAFESSINSSAKTVEVSFSLPMVDPLSNKDEGFFMYGKSFFPSVPKILAWGNPLA